MSSPRVLEPSAWARVSALVSQLLPLPVERVELLVALGNDRNLGPRRERLAARMRARDRIPMEDLLSEEPLWRFEASLDSRHLRAWEAGFATRSDLLVGAYLGLGDPDGALLLLPWTVLAGVTWTSDPDWWRLYCEAAPNLGAAEAVALVDRLRSEGCQQFPCSLPTPV